MKSQIFHLGQNHLCSVYMQTNQNCHHLAPKRAILWLFDVQTFQSVCEMEMAWEVDVLLGGFQLYVSMLIAYTLF
jgi:hypothetical protein